MQNTLRLTRINLAPYAVPYDLSLRGRAWPEPEDPSRTPFQRDRDRIIHSKAFRRLSGKTQVFIATYGDHFRDRLTHSLEVSQVARDIARCLRLNEDLAEAVALAHDLGHTPFGHAGQDALDELMREHGLFFEHNQQSKRVVEKLEIQFPGFKGLNLTGETLDGLAKHQTLYDQKTEKIRGKTLEAQLVDIADEIAYHTHDLDDGLRSKLFSMKELSRLALWRRSARDVAIRFGSTIDGAITLRRIVSQCMSLMIRDVIVQTQKNIKKCGVHSLAAVLARRNELVSFSSRFAVEIRQLRRFLWDHMYQSPAVMRHTRRGQKIIRGLFRALLKRPRLLPANFYERIDVEDPVVVVVKDYIAGMTDEFATRLYRRLGI